MKARKVFERRLLISEDTVCRMIIWALPKPSEERPHGLKYRLHFGTMDGETYVRYDNEQGKGDHRHYGNHEEPCIFSTYEKLISDFLSDVKRICDERGLNA